MSIGKKVKIALLIKLSIIVLFIFSIVGVDLYLHHHLGKQSGWNYRGYRGKVLGSKEKDEIRIACFGSSSTLGYGLIVELTWPYYLERLLLNNNVRVSVANLAANTQGIIGVLHDAQNYLSLDYDVALIHLGESEGPVGLNNTDVRQSDFFFRLFGYRPILQAYLFEKAKILKYGVNNLENAYMGRTNDALAQKERPLLFKIGASIEHLNKLIAETDKRLNKYENEAKKMQSNKQEPYADFLFALKKTFDWLLDHNKKVFYFSEPYLYDSTQQKLVRSLIEKEYKGKNVFYLDVTRNLDNVKKDYVYDGSHYNEKGNFIIASTLKEKLMEAIPGLRFQERK
ncbi:MAG: SGNH/GDSL hydrolase family protein [Oligoflexia bacterium]|nr:SGNH/GDSL hydrolase family protein [Oligoflexia bacterium]